MHGSYRGWWVQALRTSSSATSWTCSWYIRKSVEGRVDVITCFPFCHDLLFSVAEVEGEDGRRQMGRRWCSRGWRALTWPSLRECPALWARSGPLPLWGCGGSSDITSSPSSLGISRWSFTPASVLGNLTCSSLSLSPPQAPPWHRTENEHSLSLEKSASICFCPCELMRASGCQGVCDLPLQPTERRASPSLPFTFSRQESKPKWQCLRCAAEDTWLPWAVTIARLSWRELRRNPGPTPPAQVHPHVRCPFISWGRGQK